jgi:formylglycine-generating enzyme
MIISIRSLLAASGRSILSCIVMLFFFNLCVAVPPSNPSITCTGDLITINWESAKDAEIYYIYKSYDPSMEFALIDSTVNNYYSITDISPRCFFEITVRTPLDQNMIFVEGGTYLMGDHYSEGYPDELPLHSVTLNDFYIQDTEVTQKEWVSIMGYNPCVALYGLGDDFPVYGVSWYDAVVYCNKKSIRDDRTPCYKISGSVNPADWGQVPLTQNSVWDAVICDWKADGYRMLTEAEWEYASRGGIHHTDDYRFSGCHDDTQLSQYCLYESGKFIEVRVKLPNQIGIYGMSGNVCEFCWDWYNYYTKFDQINPVGFNEIAARIRRGGARYSTPKGQRVTNRASYNPSIRYTGGEIGFRIGTSSKGEEFYNVKVTFPDSHYIVQKGTVLPIRWTDNFSENVSIDLYRDGIFYRNLIPTFPSKGVFNWTVPTDLEQDQNYKISIRKAIDPSINDMSDENFAIFDKVQYEITVLCPAPNTIWMKNREQIIKWSDNFSDNVKIEIYKIKYSSAVPPIESLQLFKVVSESEVSDGVFEWTPDKTYKTDYDYRIMISNTADQSVSAVSQKFRLKEYVPQSMVFIEGGAFSMGDNLGDGSIVEKPAHTVTLNSFYMSNYEVTQEEWTSIMGSNPSKPELGISGHYPVNYLKWYSVLVYCNKKSITEGLNPCYSINGSTDTDSWGVIPSNQNTLWDTVLCNWSANGYRMPSEAEWEYASRGGIYNSQNLTYATCNTADELLEGAWYKENCMCSVHEVGSHLPNVIGLYDMNGNVWEWCWDWYGYYTTAAQADPKGPARGTYKIQRGASINNLPYACRVSARDYISISAPTYMIYSGLRLVRSN